VDYPDKVAGTVYGRDAVLRRLHDVGCEVAEPASPTSAMICQRKCLLIRNRIKAKGVAGTRAKGSASASGSGQLST